MDEIKGQDVVREAVGVFDDPDKLQAAIDELQSSGFNHHDLSLLAGEQAVQDKLGHVYLRSHEALQDEPEAPRQAYRPPEDRGNAKGVLVGAPLYIAATAAAGLIAATGGTFAALLGGAAIAGGSAGLVGMVFANKLEHAHAEQLMERLDRGGLLLWVRTPDRALEERAMAIMSAHGAADVHIHTLRVPNPDPGSATTRRIFATGKTERV